MAYGMYAFNGVLFNHESPRRGETFVMRKIKRGLARVDARLDDCFYAISFTPANLYRPGDNYQSENSHVLLALIRRFHETLENSTPNVICWCSVSLCVNS